MSLGTKVDLAKEVRRLFDAFDAQRFDDVKKMFAADAQGIDEISRAWIRGRDSIDGYFRQLAEHGVGDIQSRLTDMEARQWGDVGLVTCMADQSYTMDGERVSIHSPVSVLFRRTGDRWEIELVHAIPLGD